MKWKALIDLIELHYRNIGSWDDRMPYLLATMLQVHLFQQGGIQPQLLEKHNLGEQIYCLAEDFIYETVKAHLMANGMAIKQSRFSDTSLIAEPTYAINIQKQRDPEMPQREMWE